MRRPLPYLTGILSFVLLTSCGNGGEAANGDGAVATGDAAEGSAAGDETPDGAVPPGEASASADGATGGGAAGGGTTADGGTSTVVDVDDATVVTGWTSTDGGLVVVREGGVVIEEEDGTTVVCYETTCDGRLLECGDCVDNDGDGKVDWRDRECLGPCDNTEGPVLIAGVGGVTGSTCHVDCYFDYGNGPGTGSDDCWWDHRCDPLEPEAPACEYNEQGTNNPRMCPDDQSETCSDICIPYTPNGCDCFGCCTFPELAGAGENGEDVYVWIGAKDESHQGTCTFDDVLDRDKCPACTPVPNCLNKCGLCEVCVGKPLPDPSCFRAPDGGVLDPDAGTVDVDGGTVPGGDYAVPGQCPEGQVPCGLPGQAICDPGYYCISGCCVETII
jgi:hypothetical protein